MKNQDEEEVKNVIGLFEEQLGKILKNISGNSISIQYRREIWNLIYKGLKNNHPVSVSRKEQAFDIIAKKNVDMYRLALADNVVSYNDFTEFDEYCLTEEEFDLIKEVRTNFF